MALFLCIFPTVFNGFLFIANQKDIPGPTVLLASDLARLGWLEPDFISVVFLLDTAQSLTSDLADESVKF